MSVHKNISVVGRNPVKGRSFAFFIDPRNGAEVYVTSGNLRDAGFEVHLLHKGTPAVIDYRTFPDGKHETVKIHSLGGTPAGQPLRVQPLRTSRPGKSTQPLRLAVGETGEGELKIFFPDWNYGFLRFESSEVFFHADSMTKHVTTKDLVEGARFQFRVAKNPKGKVAVLLARV